MLNRHQVQSAMGAAGYLHGREQDQAHAVPVYRATAGGENYFYFRNIPWQSANAYGEESGPVIVRGNDHGAA